MNIPAVILGHDPGIQGRGDVWIPASAGMTNVIGEGELIKEGLRPS